MKNKVVQTKQNDDDNFYGVCKVIIMLLLATVFIFFVKSTEKISNEEAQLNDLQTVVLNIMIYNAPITKSLTDEQKIKLSNINRNIDNCIERKEQLGASGLSECYIKNKSLFKTLNVGVSDRLIFK